MHVVHLAPPHYEPSAYECQTNRLAPHSAHRGISCSPKLRPQPVEGKWSNDGRCRVLLALTLLVAVLAVPLAILGAPTASSPANIDWPAYLGDKGRSLYSPLQQINRSNVAQLKVAWTYDTGDKGEYQANNLIIAGVLYTVSPTRTVIALDAASGRELWKWNPQSERPGGRAARQRGLVFWRNQTGGEQRLFTGVGNHLYALDPKSGQVIRSFGQNGSIHLGTGLDVEGTPGVG